ncbi:MAG: hypothetical protein RH949_13615 [Coleofasciculus sp. A1-SPW-01]|uniref:hypothetical protein n=1 Tax=Coleofasciculus sp. A1-SPW-01 TaxID=3070819 RepID=UPI0032F85E23
MKEWIGGKPTLPPPEESRSPIKAYTIGNWEVEDPKPENSLIPIAHYLNYNARFTPLSPVSQILLVF